MMQKLQKRSLSPQYPVLERSSQPRRSERLRGDKQVLSQQGLDLSSSISLIPTTNAQIVAAPFINMEDPVASFDSSLAPNTSFVGTVSPFVPFSIKPFVSHDYGKLLHIDLAWEMAKASFSANDNHIVLNQQVCQVIGKQGVEELRRRLSATLGGALVSVQKDGTSENIRIMKHPGDSRMQPSGSNKRDIVNTKHLEHAQTTQTSTRKVLPRSFGKKSKIPRPPNAFILYRQHWHPHYKQQSQSMHNNDISKEIGKRWRLETEEVKAKYRKLAEDLKENHAAQNPGYHYAPRKPGEKRRRMTAKKLARILESRAQTEEEHAPSPASTTIETSSVLDGDELDELNDSCRITTHTSQDDMTTSTLCSLGPLQVEQGTNKNFMSFPMLRAEISQQAQEMPRKRNINCVDASEDTSASEVSKEYSLYARPSSGSVNLQAGWESMIDWQSVNYSPLPPYVQSHAVLDCAPEISLGPESAFNFADAFDFEDSLQNF